MEEEMLTMSDKQPKGVIKIDRPVYSNVYFEDKFPPIDNSKTCMQFMRNSWEKWSFKKTVLGFFPFIGIMRQYNIKRDAISDLVGGLTVGIMNIPQSMAYALLATLSPVYGLYTSFFPGLTYYFLGTSRHLAVGVYAVTSLMVGGAMDRMTPGLMARMPDFPLAENETCIEGEECMSEEAEQWLMNEKVILCVALTFLSGLIQVVLGMFKLGVVAAYLSQPLVKGFTTGSAIHIVNSQVAHALGLKIKRFSGPLKPVYIYIEIFKNITSANVAAIICTIICCALLIGVKEGINNNPRLKKWIKVPLPVELLVVILATIVSHFCHLHERYGLRVVGHVPRGLPMPTPPDFSQMGLVAADALAIAVVGFASSVSVAALFAKKHGYEIDANQELYALGLSNIWSSFFTCFPSSGALTRSLIQEAAGAVTQITTLVQCSFLLVVILAAGPLFYNLPNAALASIIIVALKRMFLQFSNLKTLWPISKWDFTVWLVTCLGTIFLDVTLGLMVGLGVNIMLLIIRTQRTPVASLGQVPGTDIYIDRQLCENLHEPEGIRIVKFGDSLHYANNQKFKNMMEKLIAENRRGKVRKHIGNGDGLLPKEFSKVVFDCSAMTFLDFVGVTTITSAVSDLKKDDIDVYLAACNAGVITVLETGGFIKQHGKECLFVTVHDAVINAVEEMKLDKARKEKESMEVDMHGSMTLHYSDNGHTDIKT